MGLSLYPHNEAAYKRAVHMMDATGKACVVHPTGTGKSFIGFRLCEEHPDQRVCWLSPSEYIFRTQIEGLRNSIEDGKGMRAVDDYAYGKYGSNDNQEKSCVCPYKNLRFVTYAKLSYMTEPELSELAPDYIILDEFHRCGAEVWGTGVQRLLAMYPDARLLGLSATQIRYLDNQRDMADELFDGNVASEMTLGEAIVRGILNPPRYVLSMFSYRESVERYSTKVPEEELRRQTLEQEAIASMLEGCTEVKRHYALELLKLYLKSVDVE